MKKSAFVFVCLALPASVEAASFFKCVDASGRATFTDSGCPTNHQLDDVVTAYNPRISGSGDGVKMAEPTSKKSVQQVSRSTHDGQLSKPMAQGCSTGLSDRDLRTAKVRGEIVPGMSRKEIVSIYGKPTEKGAQGSGTSTYWRKGYKELISVSYDRAGCVKTSYQSGVTP